MGCGSSSVAPLVFVINESKPGQGADAERDFTRLGLGSKVLNKFYSIFCKLDVTGSGQADLEQFYRYFHLDRSPFADRVFSILDADGSGLIDFKEFVLSVWNFCSMDTKALLRFSFALYDQNGTGYVDAEDMRALVQEVYGPTFVQNQRIAKVLEDALQGTNKNGERGGGGGDSSSSNGRRNSNGGGVGGGGFIAVEPGKLRFEDFKAMNVKFPYLMFPAFTMQATLRRETLGETFWEEQHNSRSAFAGATGAYSIWDVMTALDMSKSNYQMSKREVEAMKSQRWVPEYMKSSQSGGGGGGGENGQQHHLHHHHQNGNGSGEPEGYIPPISGDAKAKAAARRYEVYGEHGLPRGMPDGGDADVVEAEEELERFEKAQRQRDRLQRLQRGNGRAGYDGSDNDDDDGDDDGFGGEREGGRRAQHHHQQQQQHPSDDSNYNNRRPSLNFRPPAHKISHHSVHGSVDAESGNGGNHHHDQNPSRRRRSSGIPLPTAGDDANNRRRGSGGSRKPSFADMSSSNSHQHTHQQHNNGSQEYDHSQLQYHQSSHHHRRPSGGSGASAGGSGIYSSVGIANKERRRNSLVNAQDRAAAFAMMGE